MGERIRQALDRLQCQHHRALQVVQGWVLVLLMVGGGIGIGYSIGYSLGAVRTDVLLADQRATHAGEMERMHEAHRHVLERLAPMIQDAAQSAKGAATTARGAASTARRAAEVAEEAVKETPPPPPRKSVEVPEWLNTN